jgi:hypothetical protein
MPARVTLLAQSLAPDKNTFLICWEARTGESRDYNRGGSGASRYAARVRGRMASVART